MINYVAWICGGCGWELNVVPNEVHGAVGVICFTCGRAMHKNETQPEDSPYTKASRLLKELQDLHAGGFVKDYKVGYSVKMNDFDPTFCDTCRRYIHSDTGCYC